MSQCSGNGVSEEVWSRYDGRDSGKHDCRAIKRCDRGDVRGEGDERKMAVTETCRLDREVGVSCVREWTCESLCVCVYVCV